MIPLTQSTDELIVQGGRLLKHLPSIYTPDEKSSPLLALLALWHGLYRELEDLREFAGEAVDPHKAHDGPPHEFLSWLAHWVALDPGDEIFCPYPGEHDRRRLRRAVSCAAELYKHRCTAKGLQKIAAVFLDEEVSIDEWAWPRGLNIGLSSTIGIDTFVSEHEDLGGCFLVTARSPASLSIDNTGLQWLRLPLAGRDSRTIFTFFVSEPPTAGDLALLVRVRRLRRLLNAEKPAHTHCFIALDYEPLEEEAITGADVQIIGVNSIIGGCWIEIAPLLMIIGRSSIIGMCSIEYTSSS